MKQMEEIPGGQRGEAEYSPELGITLQDFIRPLNISYSVKTERKCEKIKDFRKDVLSIYDHFSSVSSNVVSFMREKTIFCVVFL